MTRIKIILLLAAAIAAMQTFAQKTKLTDYNVRWTTPGINSQGSMPIGNGDIGANVWVEQNGDLAFYIAKTDSWSEIARLLKLGKVKISITPNPFNEKTFSQELKLQNGEMVVDYGDTKIRFWIDANQPVIQADISSKTPVQVKVTYENWRKRKEMDDGKDKNSWGFLERYVQKECTDPVHQQPDVIVTGNKNAVEAYHHNGYSVWKDNLSLLSLGEFAQNNPDPLLHLTSGIRLEGASLINENDTVLKSQKPAKNFQIQVFPYVKTGSPDAWRKAVAAQANTIKKLSDKERQEKHQLWWNRFWNRSYLFVTATDPEENKKAETVTQGYILQRFVNACGGRGNYPIKFNGSLFTTDTYNRNDELHGQTADFRRWGGSYWFQNTRFPYWSMMLSGDFDMMLPLFKMYMKALPLQKNATKKYYGHDGAFFPETMIFWGTYASIDYGCNHDGVPTGYTINPYIRYYWSGGLELSLMMADYYSFTKNSAFAKDTLVPFVSEILTFFDRHWKRGGDGKILFDPSMSLETFHTAVNPLPEIVGIKAVAEKMLQLPESFIGKEKKAQWRKLITDLPAVPTRTVDGKTLLAPAHQYSNKANSENPELYAIFPYRTHTLGKPDLDVAIRTFNARVHKENGGWQQNSIQAAYLGLTEEAKKMIVQSFSSYDKNFRFPAFWGPNYDWTPDQCHGNVAMIALQRMLLQYEDDNTTLLPAWPKEWNVKFKVSAPNNTTVEGVFENGKMLNVKKNPKTVFQFK